jgi:hypothetical protein
MSDLKIDFSLSFSEKILFPFVPIYSIRHLRKEGWHNKCIGTVELFPIIGPLVALVERAVVPIFFKGDERNSPGSHINLTERINRHLNKRKEFKTNAVKYFAEVQNSLITESSPATFSLDENQREILNHVLARLQKYDVPTNVKILSSNGIWVFSVEEIPNIIFKTSQAYVGFDGSFSQKRIEATEKAKSVIESENLYLLHVPQQRLEHIEINGKTLEVLFEQRFDLLQGYQKQKTLFQYCLQDHDLQPFIKECVRQLIILIAKTGYQDVRYDNNPLLTNGKGIALIDMDKSSSPIGGLLYGCARGGEDGILQCISPQMLEELELLLRQVLSTEEFSRLKLPELKTKLGKKLTQNQSFAQYLVSRNIAASQSVSFYEWKFWHLIKNREDEIKKKLQSDLNKRLEKNIGLVPTVERQFYIYDHLHSEVLDQLKKDGKIFDWASHPSFGFHIWC